MPGTVPPASRTEIRTPLTFSSLVLKDTKSGAKKQWMFARPWYHRRVRETWRHIKKQWNRTDTVVLGSNHAALGLFIGNCWWHSDGVCYAASIVPLVIQVLHARDGKRPLRDALWFGAIIGAAWPLGEGLLASTLGWWGEYLVGGPTVWKTPVSCMLIGWLASAHLFYVNQRFMALGYGLKASVSNVALGAFLMGLLGENLLVASGMWQYRPSGFDIWAVPAFVPVAYGVGYSILPFLRDWRVLPATVVSAVFVFTACVGMGLLVGFFPA